MSSLPRWKERQLARKYGLSSSEYLGMCEQHSGACGICGQTPSANERALSIDHDHTTNTLRGLLCSRCNTAIGLFEDDIGLLENSIRYIKKYHEHPGKQIKPLDIDKLPRPVMSDETRAKMSRNHWSRRGTITHPMLGRKHSKKSIEQRINTAAKYEWTVVSPTGELFVTRTLRGFAGEHNLCVDAICHHLHTAVPPPKNRGGVISDKRKNTTGWTFSRVSL